MAAKKSKQLPILMSVLTLFLCLGLLYCNLFVFSLPYHVDIGFTIGFHEVIVALLLFVIILVIHIKKSKNPSIWFAIPAIILVFAILTVIYVPSCPICDYGVPDGQKVTFKDVFGF